MMRGMNWDYFPVGTNYSYSLWERPEGEVQAALDHEMGLLRDMRVNVIRIYAGMPARWIRYVYEKYGIWVVVNDTLGRYGMTIDGAWVASLDYSSPAVRGAVKAQMRATVASLKDTPGVLMWMLGNESNYGLFWSSTEIENLPLEKQGDARAEALYSLYGEVIRETKAADPAHPVTMANGDLQFIDLIAKHCQGLDVMGANVYRGRSSGKLFDDVRQKLKLPFIYTEFGADAWDARTMREDETTQAAFVRDLWQEIDENTWGKGKAGNAIGGFLFQFADGWWKYKQDERLDIHDTNASWANGGYPDFVEGENNMNEEWWGIMSREPSSLSDVAPLKPRASYFLLQEGFRLDPYAEGMTLEKVSQTWSALEPRAFARTAAADRAVGFIATVGQMAHVSDATLEVWTHTTGGSLLASSARDRTRFDHTESAYLGLEITPTANVRARVVVNVLGNVAQNPIDELFFENRFPGSIKLYQGTLEWNESWFDLTGFFRAGHYHWGYEGDFFALYPEANYQPSVDLYNSDAPSGVVFSGKKALDGLKVAFGPQLYWGANPMVIAKYDRKFGPVELAVMHEQDIAEQTGAATSAALPVPQTAKSTVYLGWKSGDFKLEWGGIAAGYDRLGRHYAQTVAAPAGSSTYLNSGYYVLDDTIRWYDLFGTKAKLTWTGGRVNAYVQGGYRGLVADSQTDQTITLTGWRLKESGQGNHWHAIGGLAWNVTPNFQIAPNVVYQRPLVGPLDTFSDYVDGRTGTWYPGIAAARNQFRDPFWVRSNREMLGAELLLTFDPTPDTWFWTWDNAQKENARFAASLDFVYKRLPTSTDAAVAVSKEKYPFAFLRAPPAQDLWEVFGRFVANAGDVHLAGTLWAGTGQANGDNARLVTRGGVEARVDFSRLVVTAAVKVYDWGPYDYHRDFNMTYPLQVNADVAWTLGTPRWFFPNQTKFGVQGKVRLLDLNSGDRISSQVTSSVFGTEWEVKTYVRFSL
jgi:hypothetical protein